MVEEVPIRQRARHAAKTCANCRFFDAVDITVPFCRRNPPQLVVVALGSVNDSGVRKFWPVVGPFDWCGEHKFKP